MEARPGGLIFVVAGTLSESKDSAKGLLFFGVIGVK
jgi:hypothetical protein